MASLPWAPSGGLPWAPSGGLPWLPSSSVTSGGSQPMPSQLSPEELLMLQKRIAAAKLGQQPKPKSGGIFGSLGSLADAITPDVVGLAMRQIGESLLYTPAGMVNMGAQVGSDIASTLHGRPSLRNTYNLGGAMLNQVSEDFAHPLRNPGYLAMDVATLGGAGAVTAGKVAEAMRAVQAERALRVPKPIIDPGTPLPPGPTQPVRPPWTPPTPSAPAKTQALVVRDVQKAQTATPGIDARVSPPQERAAQTIAQQAQQAVAPAAPVMAPVNRALLPRPTLGAREAPGRVGAMAQQLETHINRSRAQGRSVDVGSRPIMQALNELDPAGYTARIENGRVRILPPGEAGGAPISQVVREANAAENLFQGLARGGEQKLSEAAGKTVAEQVAADMEAWKRQETARSRATGQPMRSYPITDTRITDQTLLAAQRIENEMTALERGRVAKPEMTAASEAGPGAIPYRVADATTGMEPPPLTEAQLAMHEKRVVAQRRKLAKDAGFTNTEAAARSMGQVGAMPMDPAAIQRIKAQRAEADRLANDRSRVSSRNPTVFEQYPYMETALGPGQATRYIRGPRVKQEPGGMIMVDGKASGVMWRRDPNNPKLWQVIASDRAPFSDRAELISAAKGYVEQLATEAKLPSEAKGLRANKTDEQVLNVVRAKYPGGMEAFLRDNNLQREISATSAREAYTWARRDAVEKVLQEKDAGTRSLDMPEIPALHINGEPVSAQRAVELGQAKEAAAVAAKREEERLARIAADQEAAKAAMEAEQRRQIAIKALQEQGLMEGQVDPAKPVPPAVQDFLKEEAPPEIHDQIDQLAFDETKAPEAADLANMPEEQLLTDAEMGSLMDELAQENAVASENPFDWNPNEAKAPSQQPEVAPESKPQPAVELAQAAAADTGLTEQLSSAQAAEQAKGRLGSRKRFSAREVRTNVNSFKGAGYADAEASMLSKLLTKPMQALYDRVGGTPNPSEIKAEIKRVVPGLTDEQVAEIHDRVWLGQEKKVKSEITMQHGSLRANLAKFYKGKLDDAQLDELAQRVGPDLSAIWKAARDEGRQVTSKELLQVLEQHTTKEVAGKLFQALYKVSGSGGESLFKIFVSTLFGPSKRQTYTLARTDWEKTDEAGYHRALSQGHAAERRVTGQRRQQIRGKLGSYTGPLENQYSYYARVARTAEAQLSVNPLRRGFQRFLYEYGVNRAPEWQKGGPKLANARARYAKNKLEFELNQRLAVADRMATLTEEPKGKVDEGKMQPLVGGVGRLADTFNQLAVLLTLYTKPGYLPPNMLGQILFNTIDNTWNPIAIARSYKFSNDVRKGLYGEELRAKLHEAMGSGMYESVRPERGFVPPISKANERLARAYGKVLDVPFREAAFYNSAYRAGFRSSEEIRRLLSAKPGEKLHEDLVSVALNANRDIVDYTRLNKVEKQAIRRVVFFYPWIKGSTVYTGRFAMEHPFQAGLAMQSARIGQEKAHEILGDVPSYLKGLVPLGSTTDVPGMGALPNVSNPAAASIFGSAGQALNAARGTLFGDVRSGEQLSEYFTPLVSASIAAATRVDPFTGARYEQGVSPLEIFGQEMKDTMAPLRWWDKRTKAGEVQAGTRDASKMLFPSTPMQEDLAFLLGSEMPRTYNLAEGQQRATAETTGLKSKQEQIKIKWNDRIRVASDAAKKVGLRMDATIAKAFQQKADRQANYEAWAQSQGRKITDMKAIDRLMADMNLLVRRGIYREPDAKQILASYAQLDDNAINNFRRQLGYSYFGQAQLSAWKAAAVQAGADPKAIDTDF